MPAFLSKKIPLGFIAYDGGEVGHACLKHILAEEFYLTFMLFSAPEYQASCKQAKFLGFVAGEPWQRNVVVLPGRHWNPGASCRPSCEFQSPYIISRGLGNHPGSCDTVTKGLEEGISW